MSAGVAGCPLVGRDLSITDWVGSSGVDFQRLLLGQTVAPEVEAMGIVNDPVEDGVGESGLADQVMPAVDRDLAGDQGGAAAVTIFHDLKHVVTLLGSEGFEPPIVEDQQLDAAEGAHQSREAAIAASERKIAEHPRHALIKHRPVVAAGLLTEGTSQPAFADAFGNMRIDAAVSAEVLRAISPLALDAAFQMIADCERAGAERLRQRELALEQACYEATRARRQYDAVDPDNRLVAGELERRWNECLAAVVRIEDEIRNECADQPAAVSDDERTALLALADDLPRLWNHSGSFRRDPQTDLAGSAR